MTTLAEQMSLRGRVALVTGAAGALGRVIANTLGELKADLLLVDRQGTDWQELVSSLTSTWGVAVEGVDCDLEQQEERDALMQRVKREHAHVSVLVNNAAFVGSSALTGWAVPLEEQTVDTWRRAVEVNLTAAFDLSKTLIPLLRRGPGGNIINVASIYGVVGPDWSLYDGTALANPAAYAASKGGLIQLTRWLATTTAPHVRVNAISPGGIFRNQPEQFVARYAARTPLGRMATEDDLRGGIAYLATDLSKYVTGQHLLVDGGWTAW